MLHTRLTRAVGFYHASGPGQKHTSLAQHGRGANPCGSGEDIGDPRAGRGNVSGEATRNDVARGTELTDVDPVGIVAVLALELGTELAKLRSEHAFLALRDHAHFVLDERTLHPEQV
jgi:hypothetical protein